MAAFLKLIRIQNLLIIVFTQYMVRWCLLYPILKFSGFELQMSNFLFFLLSLSTVMIAAAGYIINDYFDVRIDKINKPERMIIDKGIKRRVAIGAHTLINILALLIGLYVSYAVGAWKLVIIHLVCATGLWFYSTNFKRQFLIGNLVIAAFTALVPMITAIYELAGCFKENYATAGFEGTAWKWVLALSFFAFLTTLIREIIKDMEDLEGDKEFGCRTMPIVIGLRSSKMAVMAVTIFTMILLAYFQNMFYEENKTFFYYFLFALQLPFTFVIYKVMTAQTKKDFRLAGNTAKFIMLMGVCYLFFFANSILSAVHAVQ
jgi:4-hydroxybenzoate polyprenyltransferase